MAARAHVDERAGVTPGLRCWGMAPSRSAQVYADFLLCHLSRDMHVIDVGCGSGELSLELAAEVGHLTGIDGDAEEIELARSAAEASSTSNAAFTVGDAYALPLADSEADAVFAHSVLEALDRPGEALAEMSRVLKRDGVVAVACVDYGGLILAGPHEPLLRRFFAIREELWLRDGVSPYRGRELRQLLLASGFRNVQATGKYVSYGNQDAVREFGIGRADDCDDEWYAESAQREGLATLHDLGTMRDAWQEWSESPASYAAFAWCRALGWKM
jgi:ubiquinone/menaquinone biosynthesis C-methylase UbiE